MDKKLCSLFCVRWILHCPNGMLANLSEGCILDEVLRLPVLLSYIQDIVDGNSRKGVFILTGSYQPLLQTGISQSLAGRTAMLSLWPFSMDELRPYYDRLDPFDLIAMGSFPRLHNETLEPKRFFNDYVHAYVEWDARELINRHGMSQFPAFLTLLAERVGELLNIALLSSILGASRPTVNTWLDVLKASFVVFELPPYCESARKCVVRSRKIYFTDVGLVAFLLGIHTSEHAMRYPLRGDLYEYLVIADIVKGALNRGIRPDIYSIRNSNGVEVDLLIRERGAITPIEIESSQTFSTDFLQGIERLESLGVPNLRPGFVLYNGAQRFAIHGTRIFNPLGEEDIWGTLTGGG